MAENTLRPAAANTPTKFETLMELGEGGMGVVHLAMSRGPRGFVKLVVLKSLKREFLGTDSAYRMFLEEARISARLTHPNLVQTYEVIEIDRTPTMVLEYVEGQSLSAVVKAVGGKLRRDIHHELRDYDGTPLNLVHRDVSPHNVMVQYDGQVKILDFGIAKTERSKVHTQVGVVKGKIRYMAPQQLLGEELDRRADVFSVGLMLWEAMTGNAFWRGLSDGEVMRCLLNGKLPALPEGGDIPKELVHMCQHALAFAPEERFATADDFRLELDAYLVSTGQQCTADQIGEFMKQRFGAARENTNRVINAHIRALEVSRRPPASATAADVATVAFSKVTPGAFRLETEFSRTRRMRLPARRWGIAFAVAAAATLVVVWRSHRSGSTAIWVEKTKSAQAPGLSCPPGAKLCNERCVSLDQPEFGCGAPQCFRCDIANATARCNRLNECDIAVCYQAFDNCDGNAANGCETNVRIDPDHCGSCQHLCPDLPHAQRGCGDVCTIWRCDAGYRDCNGVVADGCEVAVGKDRLNCGHCGARCPPGKSCHDGRCQS
jgi:serine/threonine protein kinase